MRKRLGSLVVVAALVFAGCGRGDGDDVARGEVEEPTVEQLEQVSAPTTTAITVQLDDEFRENLRAAMVEEFSDLPYMAEISDCLLDELLESWSIEFLQAADDDVFATTEQQLALLEAYDDCAWAVPPDTTTTQPAVDAALLSDDEFRAEVVRILSEQYPLEQAECFTERWFKEFTPDRIRQQFSGEPTKAEEALYDDVLANCRTDVTDSTVRDSSKLSADELRAVMLEDFTVNQYLPEEFANCLLDELFENWSLEFMQAAFDNDFNTEEQEIARFGALNEC